MRAGGEGGMTKYDLFCCTTPPKEHLIKQKGGILELCGAGRHQVGNPSRHAWYDASARTAARYACTHRHDPRPVVPRGHPEQQQHGVGKSLEVGVLVEVGLQLDVAQQQHACMRAMGGCVGVQGVLGEEESAWMWVLAQHTSRQHRQEQTPIWE